MNWSLWGSGERIYIFTMTHGRCYKVNDTVCNFILILYNFMLNSSYIFYYSFCFMHFMSNNPHQLWLMWAVEAEDYCKTSSVGCASVESEIYDLYLHNPIKL